MHQCWGIKGAGAPHACLHVWVSHLDLKELSLTFATFLQQVLTPMTPRGNSGVHCKVGLASGDDWCHY